MVNIPPLKNGDLRMMVSQCHDHFKGMVPPLNILVNILYGDVIV